MSFDEQIEKDPFLIAGRWRAGHTLSAEDIKAIEGMYEQWEAESDKANAAFTAGREQALREIGGQELVDADIQATAARSRYMVIKALKGFQEKAADYAAKAANL